MAKYRDLSGMGKSALFPKPKGVSPKVRHIRRKYFNLENINIVTEFCSTHGLHFTVTNFGEHWQVVSSRGTLIEWWPRSAKLVVNKQWKRGIHCHDYRQFIEAIKKAVGLL